MPEQLEDNRSTVIWVSRIGGSPTYDTNEIENHPLLHAVKWPMDCVTFIDGSCKMCVLRFSGR